MLLIIDSGATKTEYALSLHGEIVFRFVNEGININYRLDEEVHAILTEFIAALPKDFHSQIHHLFFYGAGCGRQANAERLSKILEQLFHFASVTVYSDLLGACHALCGRQKGWVAILGTGSSSCYYDGENITFMAPSLGYMFGDEGSGTHLGKLFLAAYLSDSLPQGVKKDFEEKHQLSAMTVLNRIYQQALPNRFFSSFAPYLLENMHIPEISEICSSSFHEFIEKQIRYHPENIPVKELNLIGSIAFYFRKLISKVAEKHGVVIHKTIISPTEDLIIYHNQIF